MVEALRTIGREAIWAPIAVIVIHSVAGGLLGHEPFVDPVMHFSGGVAAAFFFWRSATACRQFLGELSPGALALLSFGLATVAAVGWEFAEFLVDSYRGTSIQRSIANTMRDLFLGMSGATIYVISCVVIEIRRARR